jgi:hypothetical protein
MNRYVRAATAALAIAGGLGSVGCVHNSGSTRADRDGGRWNNLYDTAWPDRYNFAARQATVAPFAQQVTNGQFFEQTVWNWYFEPGTDRLNGAGMAKLDSLAQRAPVDSRIYLQAARDVPATADNFDKVVAMRDDLTTRRAAAVQKYMATQPGAPVAYEIAVHDAPVPGIYSPFPLSAFRGQTRGYVGGIGGSAVVGQLNPTAVGGMPAGGGGVGAAAGAGAAVPVPAGNGPGAGPGME